MDDPELHRHLSRISTRWSMVLDAHADDKDAALVRGDLLLRYCGAVYRYLVHLLRDPHAADELAQEFALAFVQGKFQKATPEKGRFRDYVKASLFNLVRKHYRRKTGEPLQDSEDLEPAAAQSTPESGQEFVRGWREEILARTWEALAKADATQHAVLDHRTRHPGQSSTDMAAALAIKLGKKVNAGAVRQTLHRARDRFAQLLLDEVGRSLETADLDSIEREVIDLGLHAYCKDAIQQRRAGV